MDVKTAFLNGILKEEIYMNVPEGIQCNNNVLVRKLDKTLYGLKQSGRCWFETFEKILIEMGFKESPLDTCVYILNRYVYLKIYILYFTELGNCN